MKHFKYYKIYKPYGMLSQFTREGFKAVLADLFPFPKDVYPVGRLDSDSEGLLLLTNDKHINQAILNPVNQHARTYLVQVEGHFTHDACEQLEEGLEISISGNPYFTLPAFGEILSAEPALPARIPPIRFRKNIPTSWIRLTLTEGKNRQVRKMTAKVGFPTLRLVRESIEDIKLGNMPSGEVVELERKDVYKKLNL